MTVLRSVPCSTGSRGQWPPSPATAPTTAMMSTPNSRRAIPRRRWSCRRVRMRAQRSRGDRPNAARRASAMYRRARPPGLAESLRVQLARPGGGRYRALEAPHRRWAPFANRRATGDRSGDRRRRAEPNAGAGTPGVRPHRITRNMGRAQCAHTADPCNICGPRVIAERARAVDSAAIRAIVVRWLAPSEV